MIAKFNDHFSGVAPDYRKFRPLYPSSLFAFLSFITPHHETAWDCATGSGQSAKALAQVFARVIATDASQAQIDQAARAYNIQYSVCPAEQSHLKNHSVDLITVAQALHWFDIDKFFAEADRVLKPGGVLAVWTYNLLSINSAIDAIINELYSSVLRDYWPSERKLIDDGYQSVSFPFQEVQAPAFAMTTKWDLRQLIGYFNTWSAVNRYRAQHNGNPVDDIQAALESLWGDTKKQLKITWPLTVKVRVKWK